MGGFELTVLVLGGTLSLLGIAGILGGGRRWKGNFEAEHVRAERLEATLLEKNKLVEVQGERLQRLEGIVQELGGTRVFEALVTQQAAVGGLFKKLFADVDAAERRQLNALERHEERATERHRRLLGLIETIGLAIAERNGHTATGG